MTALPLLSTKGSWHGSSRRFREELYFVRAGDRTGRGACWQFFFFAVFECQSHTLVCNNHDEVIADGDAVVRLNGLLAVSYSMSEQHSGRV